MSTLFLAFVGYTRYAFGSWVGFSWAGFCESYPATWHHSVSEWNFGFIIGLTRRPHDLYMSVYQGCRWISTNVNTARTLAMAKMWSAVLSYIFNLNTINSHLFELSEIKFAHTFTSLTTQIWHSWLLKMGGDCGCTSSGNCTCAPGTCSCPNCGHSVREQTYLSEDIFATKIADWFT